MLTSLPFPSGWSVEGPDRCQQDRSHREEEEGGKDEEDEREEHLLEAMVRRGAARVA
jgi:hypothetical protein